MPKIIALILARGGSKGLPGKNIKPLGGVPLITHTIQHAKACKNIDQIYVSTDSDEIAKISEESGALVPFKRPKEISGDYSTDLDCFDHFLSWWRGSNSSNIDALVHMRCTTPFRDTRLLEEAIDLFIESPEYDSLRSVAPSPQTPYKMWKIKGGDLIPFSSLVINGQEAFNVGRQLLPEVFVHDGFVDILRPKCVTEFRSMTGNRVMPFRLDVKSIDIDTEEDFRDAENVIKSGL